MLNYRNNTPDYMRRPDNSACFRENPCVSEQKNCCCENNSYCRQVYKKDDCLSDFAIAMAYVPWQDWNCPYSVEKGLQCGTIFKELDKPFRGIGGCNR